MTELKERDSMICRACGLEERASEGYPCADCGTFICVVCSMRGVTLCRECAARVPDVQPDVQPGGAASGGAAPGGPAPGGPAPTA